ncbi:MAG: argininosuccinate lyase [Actinobacteria bacterium]|nr:argininosuccinate lyase [Actinomycetota bacterium]
MSEDNSMLWGGRFATGPSAEMIRLTGSIDVDLALLECDARATKAHARVLVAAGLLDEADLGPIDTALDTLVEEWRKDELVPHPADEDVHSLVERELTDRLGDLGARIHAGRSRNDLVAQDLRLWCRDAAGDLLEDLAGLVETIAGRAEEHADTLMPGFTHLQPAQPVTVGFHLLAHGFALARDLDRMSTARDIADVGVLGAGALAGTTLPLDPSIGARELGCEGLFDNAMHAVSDRDFACDLVYATATLGVHLSRMAEEIVLWTSPLLGFARLPEEWSTGSSMMPQKRNPDMAELVRGRAAGPIGELTSLLTLLKGLPLAYARDLQEDKAVVFRAVERARGCLAGMTAMVGGLIFDEARLAGAAALGGSWATDVAELLVARGLPFREAHEVAGRLVAAVEDSGEELAPEVLASHHDLLQASDLARLAPARSVAARASHGGPAPARVKEQVGRLRRRVLQLRQA